AGPTGRPDRGAPTPRASSTTSPRATTSSTTSTASGSTAGWGSRALAGPSATTRSSSCGGATSSTSGPTSSAPSPTRPGATPTTLLAQQHFGTFSERYAGYPVRVEVLSRFLTPGQAKKVVDGLADGSVDVVIGTHRLLSADIKFKNLGLLVVDEEQRFGVTHKELIKQLRTDVDVLTLTATTIPRTLEMSLTGIRALTLLHTTTAERYTLLSYDGERDE